MYLRVCSFLDKCLFYVKDLKNKITKKFDFVQNVIVPANCYISEITIESEFKLDVNLTWQMPFRNLITLLFIELYFGPKC